VVILQYYKVHLFSCSLLNDAVSRSAYKGKIIYAEVKAGNPKERHHLEDLSTDRREILILILKTNDGKLWIGFIWHRIWTSGGLF
jgi:hypothetical protein